MPSTVAADGVIISAVQEVERAFALHGRDKWGRHEFYAVLREEVDELWDVIKTDGDSDSLYEEMVQIVAMVLRYAETGNRYSPTL